MKLTIRFLIMLSFLFVVESVLFAAEKPQRPNIVFILTDDQNYDTIGTFGGKVLTPTMDRLATEGVKFTKAFTVHGICTPSRYVCLTGQYASRCETENFLRQCPPGTPSIIGFNVQVPPGTWNVAAELKKAGYTTGFFGKWHTGGAKQKLQLPEDADYSDPEVKKKLQAYQRELSEYVHGAGFDVADRIYHGNVKDLNGLVYHNLEWVTEGAINFIDANHDKDKPFYLHFCTTLQHGPNPNISLTTGDPLRTPIGNLDTAPTVQAPRSSIADRLAKSEVAPALGHATWLDDAFAAIVARLEKYDLLDNTAILVFSDNATMKGKGTCYDGGTLVPAFVYWKGHFTPGAECKELIGNIDYVPTILDLAGIKKPDDVLLDGQSFLPIVTGQKEVKWRDAIYLEVGHTRAVRTGKWKYLTIRYAPSLQKQIADNTLGRPAWHADTVFDLQAVAEKNHPAYWDVDQLYDVENDPLEQKNLASDPKYAEILKELKLKHTEFAKKFPRPYGEFNP
jgi:arylsulfatase A-like enzyme